MKDYNQITVEKENAYLMRYVAGGVMSYAAQLETAIGRTKRSSGWIVTRRTGCVEANNNDKSCKPGKCIRTNPSARNAQSGASCIIRLAFGVRSRRATDS